MLVGRRSRNKDVRPDSLVKQRNNALFEKWSGPVGANSKSMIAWQVL